MVLLAVNELLVGRRSP